MCGYVTSHCSFVVFRFMILLGFCQNDGGFVMEGRKKLNLMPRDVEIQRFYLFQENVLLTRLTEAHVGIVGYVIG